MKVTIGELARDGIEARLGVDAAAGALRAMQRYADRLDGAEAPPPPPRFLEDRAYAEAEEPLELELGEAALGTLEREAERRMVPLERIASHAVLAYLAELDAISAVSIAYQRTPDGLR